MPNAKKLSAQARREDQGAKPRAARMFTDREDLRGAYHALAERALREDFEDVYVINYYGVGGAGKSMLLRKIRDEVAERAQKDTARRHITLMLDFDTVPADMVTALEHLKAQLQKQGFRFPLFEMALYMLYEKSGRVLTGQEQADFFAKNPEVDIVADMVDMIPGVGIVTNLIRNAAKLTGRLKDRARELVEGRKRTLYEIEKMDENALLRNLPLLFAEDANGQTEDGVLHVFIDTYEKLVSLSEGTRGERTAPGNDQWLYGREGLIRNLGNAVFAIGGREKLSWAESSEYWESRVEGHLTAHLSEADSSLFLSSCGVPGALWPALYALTGGEPVFLDLCVDRYLDLLEIGRTPGPEDFGGNVETLVERHTRYLPANLLDAAYLLGGMRRWDGRMFDRAAQAAGIRVNPSEYREKLLGLSYVTDEGGGVCSMHQVIANILASRLPEDLAERASAALAELAEEGLEEEDAPDQSLVLEAAVCLAGQKAVTEDLVWALTRQASKDGERLRFTQQLRWQQQAVDTFRAVLGPEHPDTLLAMENLAGAWGDLVDYERARTLYGQVYEARERTLGPEHPETLMALGNLATTYSKLGDYEHSRALAEKVYEDRRRVLGPEHPDTLLAMGNLASAWDDVGDYERARMLYEKECETLCRLCGEEHPDTLASLGNLAHALNCLGQYGRALELDEKVYEARRRMLGPEHPLTLLALGNMASVRSKLGDFEKARELGEQAYEASARVLGPEHPETLVALGNLAGDYDNLGDHEKARELAEKTYEARARVLGPEHPETLVALGNLSHVWLELGDYERAREINEKVYETQRRVLGEEHPSTLLSLGNLAYVYDVMGDHEKARELGERVYEARSRVLGPDHPETLRAMGDLASACADMGDYARALELEKQIYEARARVQGPEHANTLIALGNMAYFYEEQGELDKARALYEKQYEARSRVLGPEHPDTLVALENLADICDEQGEHAKARELYEKLYQAKSHVLGPEHPDTLLALKDLAFACNDMGEYAQALALEKREYETQCRVLGEDHPDTLMTMGNMAISCNELGDYAQARALYEKQYEALRRVLGEEHPDTQEALRRLKKLSG